MQMSEMKEDCEHLAPNGSNSSSENDHGTAYVKKKHKKYLNRRSYVGHIRSGKSCQFPVFFSLFMVLLVWTIGLSWVTSTLRADVDNVSNKNRKIMAEHKGMIESIKRCNSISGKLLKNQTDINSKLLNVIKVLTNASSSLTEVQSKEHSLEKKVNVTPELVALPGTLHSLMGSIASIGSQIDDFNGSIAKVLSELALLKQRLGDIPHNSSGTVNSTDAIYRKLMKNEPALQADFSLIKEKLSAIDDVLSNHMKLMSEDERKLQGIVRKLKFQFDRYSLTTDSSHSPSPRSSVTNEAAKTVKPTPAINENKSITSKSPVWSGISKNITSLLSFMDLK